MDTLPERQRIDRITRTDAARWRADMDGSHLSEASVCQHVRNAKTICGHAVRLGIIQANPMDVLSGTPAARDNDWFYVTADDMADILDACHTPGQRAFVALLRWAGLRRGEALALRWQDIDWHRHNITVNATTTRRTTKQRRRTVPIRPELYKLLVENFEQLRPGETCVCGIGNANVRRTVKAIVKRAGMTPWTKLLHTLRKNAESDWLAEYPVMDVCRWLGHAPNVAAAHYHQTTDATLAAVTGKHQDTTEQQLRDRIARLEAQLER